MGKYIYIYLYYSYPPATTVHRNLLLFYPVYNLYPYAKPEMESVSPETVELPSVRSIFQCDDHFVKRLGVTEIDYSQLWHRNGHKTDPLQGCSSFRSVAATVERPATPEPERANAIRFYPSPESDLDDDVKMISRTVFEGQRTHSWVSDGSIINETSNATEQNTPGNPAVGLTPTIVHYRPNGIPNVRSRKIPEGDMPKGRRRKSTDVEVKLVKWDRTSDKGTAPLNMEPRYTGPRSCTLCYLSKKKVPSATPSQH